MATIVSDLSFNQNNLDLSRLYFNSTNSYFFDNINYSVWGETYSDVFEAQWYLGGTYYASLFGGYNMTVNASGEPTSGRVTGYLESYWNGAEWIPYSGIQGIDVSAAELFDAATTSSTKDDYRIINGELSGSDTFILSDQRDVAKGLGGKDFMYGYGGNDKLKGGDGNDKVYGGGGKDTLEGGSGKDLLVGHNGDDILKGGTGDDRLRGGSGEDRFMFKTGWDVDTIKDFDAKGAVHDVLDLSGLNSVKGWRDLKNNHLEQDGPDVVIDGKNGDVVILEGVDVTDLDKGDFIF